MRDSAQRFELRKRFATLYPVPLRGLLLGIPHAETSVAAAALRRAGIRKGLVVCGALRDEFSMDEISVFGPTRMSVLSEYGIEEAAFHPESVGCRHARWEDSSASAACA